MEEEGGIPTGQMKRLEDHLWKRGVRRLTLIMWNYENRHRIHPASKDASR
ncbi:MAG: hypothetical protein ACLTT1_05175 [[Clostridium] scindens]